MRSGDKLLGYSQVNQNQGAYIYIRRKLSRKEPIERGKKTSLTDSIKLPAVIHETTDTYGDFKEPGMRAMQEQQIIANESMRRLMQKSSYIDSIKKLV